MWSTSKALFYYVFFKYPVEQRNITSVVDLIRRCEPDQKTGATEIVQLFDKWAEEDPENIGVKQWKYFKVLAGSPKTMNTIIITATAHLSQFEENGKNKEDERNDLNVF